MDIGDSPVSVTFGAGSLPSATIAPTDTISSGSYTEGDSPIQITGSILLMALNNLFIVDINNVPINLGEGAAGFDSGDTPTSVSFAAGDMV